MPKDAPSVGFVRVKAYGDLSPSIDDYYNRPSFNDDFTQDDFEREYFDILDKLRAQLEIFGKVSNFDEGINLGEPEYDNGRRMGIVLSSLEYFRPELIKAIQAFLQGIGPDYFVYIDGSFTVSEDQFYICITKEKVTGYSEDEHPLKLFGFRT